jgi:1-phosphatidylinositol-4-phosphate 5-kinase
MPSQAADSDNSYHHRQQQTAYELPTRTSSKLSQEWPLRTPAEKQTNGEMTANGTNRWAPPSDSSAHVNGNHRGCNVDIPDARGNSGELSARDDGYFASANNSAATETDEGCTSTHVKLGSLNMNDGSGGSKESRSDLIAPTSHDSDLHPPTNSLQIPAPNSAYRASSPATFNHKSIPPEPPYRLQHRHTLEVPKVSSQRPREPQNTTDDVVTASGRFSPNTPTRRRNSMSLARRATRSVHSDMHLDEVPQDEDAARWAEHIRQKRASKRKRKEDEDDDRVVVGTKVDQNHVNWVTAYNMLTGIRFTVSRTNAKMVRELTDADFDAKHKFSFDMYVPENFSLQSLLLLFNLSCGYS